MITYILIGIYAFVWANILIAEGEIFGFVKQMLLSMWFENPSNPDMDDLSKEQYVIWKIITCQDCHAGQFSLWFSILYLEIYLKSHTWLLYFFGIMVSICVAHFLNLLNNYFKLINEINKR